MVGFLPSHPPRIVCDRRVIDWTLTILSMNRATIPLNNLISFQILIGIRIIIIRGHTSISDLLDLSIQVVLFLNLIPTFVIFAPPNLLLHIHQNTHIHLQLVSLFHVTRNPLILRTADHKEDHSIQILEKVWSFTWMNAYDSHLSIHYYLLLITIVTLHLVLNLGG